MSGSVTARRVARFAVTYVAAVACSSLAFSLAFSSIAIATGDASSLPAGVRHSEYVSDFGFIFEEFGLVALLAEFPTSLIAMRVCEKEQFARLTTFVAIGLVAAVAWLPVILAVLLRLPDLSFSGVILVTLPLLAAGGSAGLVFGLARQNSQGQQPLLTAAHFD
jgi:hypothetical protein